MGARVVPPRDDAIEQLAARAQLHHLQHAVGPSGSRSAGQCTRPSGSINSWRWCAVACARRQCTATRLQHTHSSNTSLLACALLLP